MKVCSKSELLSDCQGGKVLMSHFAFPGCKISVFCHSSDSTFNMNHGSSPKVDQGAKHIVVDPSDWHIARVCRGEELLHGNTGQLKNNKNNHKNNNNNNNNKITSVFSIYFDALA